jgi:hypothetical protein
MLLGLAFAVSRQDGPLATSYSVGHLIGVRACHAVIGERESKTNGLANPLVTINLRAIPPQYRVGAASGCAADYS